MFIDERKAILRVVDSFASTGNVNDEAVKVICLPDNKTSWVEQTGTDGRSIMMDEYRVDSKVIWAGYSGFTGTVYLSSVQNH